MERRELLAQSVEDLERIDQAVDAAAITGWDVAGAVAILVASWPIGLLLGKMAERLIRRVPGARDYAADVGNRTVRVIVLFTALASALSLLGVDVGWFTVVVLFTALLSFLMLRPLIENLAAGLLLATRPSFGIGDEIEFKGVRGAVVEINARSTVIQTSDWRRIHIPNQDVLDDPITVFTALDRRRSEIELGIAYEAEPGEVVRVLLEAVSGVEGVWADPAPHVRALGFGTNTYTMLLRWWHNSDLSSASRTRDGAVLAVKQSLDGAGIEMPAPEAIIRHPDTADE